MQHCTEYQSGKQQLIVTGSVGHCWLWRMAVWKCAVWYLSENSSGYLHQSSSRTWAEARAVRLMIWKAVRLGISTLHHLQPTSIPAAVGRRHSHQQEAVLSGEGGQGPHQAQLWEWSWPLYCEYLGMSVAASFDIWFVTAWINIPRTCLLHCI